MKITNSETIKSSERELIDAITGDLDWRPIEELIRQRHNLAIQDDVAYQDGDIIVHDSQVAYRLDFEVKMILSVIFDRDGNFLSLRTSESAKKTPDQAETQEETPAEQTAQGLASASGEPAPEEAKDDIIKLTSELADMTYETSQETSGEAPVGDSGDEGGVSSPAADAKLASPSPGEAPQQRMATMATHIASMISKINEDPS